jgi:hypothetical protein
VGGKLATTDQVENLRWLLSTTSQSSAALVAIIGGFLLSRVLSLSSERGSLVRQRRSLSLEQTQHIAESEEIHSKIRTLATEDFLKSYSDDFAEALGGKLTVAEPLSQAGLTAEEIEKLSDDLTQQVRGFVKVLEDFCPTIDDIPLSIDELNASPALRAVSNQQLFLKVAKRVHKIRKSQLPPDPIFGNFAQMAIDIPNVSFTNNSNTREIQKLLAKVDSIDSRIEAGAVLIEHLSKQIRDSQNLDGFAPALVLLSIFGVVGIAGPMAVSLFEVTDPHFVGLIDVIVFCGFFVFFVLFLVWEARRVKKPKKQQIEANENR